MRARFDRLPLPAVALVVALLALVGLALATAFVLRGDQPSVITGALLATAVVLVAILTLTGESRARREAGGEEALAVRRAAERGEGLPDDAPPEWWSMLRRAEDQAQSGRIAFPVIFGFLGLWYVLAPGAFEPWVGRALGISMLVAAVARFIDGRVRPPRIRRLVEELERRYPADVRAAAAGA